MKRKYLEILIILTLLFLTLALFAVFVINFSVKYSVKDKIVAADNAVSSDCILVFGAGVWGNSPSPMLCDRLDFAIDLYKKGVAKKIIMSGDHGRQEYDEVNIMKSYAVSKGVPSEDIFMDHAGFSTYDSIYRAKAVFCAEKITVVTQGYHLYRVLYVAESLGISAQGVAADPRLYVGQTLRDAREILARNKDFLMCIFKPKPTFLGEEIPVSGNGDITNDK